jgi:peptidoglycan/xylan/chitin deacetylase (PgdA/CDA1 family)
VKRQLGQAVKAIAAIDTVIRPPAPGVPILIYHRVGGRTPVAVDLPRQLFAEQMAELAGRLRPVSLQDVTAGTDGPERGRPPVVVTFDDGTADFVDQALPVLVEHGVPVTLYIATEHIEHQRDFPDEGRPVSWDGLRDALATRLVTIGSHTHSHLLLDRVDPALAASDLDRSCSLIEDRLGISPTHFAYPKALLASAEVEPLVRERFTTAVLAGSRPAPLHPAADLHRLPRIPIQVGDGMRWFRRKLGSGMPLEDRLRGLKNKRGYAGRTN